LKTDGLPWSRPLYVLPIFYRSLYEKLREEQLVPDDLDRVLWTLPRAKLNYSRSQLLYKLNDTFIVDFSRGCTTYVFVITERGVEGLVNRKMNERNIFQKSPYSGAYTNHHLSILLH
jgi:hypothetical protein